MLSDDTDENKPGSHPQIRNGGYILSFQTFMFTRQLFEDFEKYFGMQVID